MEHRSFATVIAAALIATSACGNGANTAQPDAPRSQPPPTTSPKPQASSSPPARAAVPSWDATAERYRPGPDTMAEVYLDMLRYGCTRSIECGSHNGDIFACIDELLPGICRQFDCTAPITIDRHHPAWPVCLQKFLDAPCGREANNQLDCTVPPAKPQG